LIEAYSISLEDDKAVKKKDISHQIVQNQVKAKYSDWNVCIWNRCNPNKGMKEEAFGNE
jgi:hypothetical protein